MPWAAAEQTLWFAAGARRPESVTTADDLKNTVKYVTEDGIDTEMDGLRVFAQLYMLENGSRLQAVLSIPDFKPRCVTITLRHTDWWFWETDRNLGLDSGFVNLCRFPESVKEVRMELESVERRKGQILSIARQMQDKWYFKRNDGAALRAKSSSLKELIWTGSATWEGCRWVRDEVAPNQLRYFMATVVWRPEKSPSVLQGLPATCPCLRAEKPPPPYMTDVEYITEWDRQKLEIHDDTPTAEAIRIVTDYRDNWQQRGEEVRPYVQTRDW